MDFDANISKIIHSSIHTELEIDENTIYLESNKYISLSWH